MNISTETIKKTPRVYVACLASYNAGILHGKWVEVTSSEEELLNEIKNVLNSSTEEGAEEWAFHDHEYFEPFNVEEYTSTKTLCEYASVLLSLDQYDLEAFQKFEGDLNGKADEILENFHESYMGSHESEEEYAEYLFNECYEIPEKARYYIDYKSFWRDLTYNGYYSAESKMSNYRTVHIFLNS